MFKLNHTILRLQSCQGVPVFLSWVISFVPEPNTINANELRLSITERNWFSSEHLWEWEQTKRYPHRVRSVATVRGRRSRWTSLRPPSANLPDGTQLESKMRLILQTGFATRLKMLWSNLVLCISWLLVHLFNPWKFCSSKKMKNSTASTAAAARC